LINATLKHLKLKDQHLFAQAIEDSPLPNENADLMGNG